MTTVTTVFLLVLVFLTGFHSHLFLTKIISRMFFTFLHSQLLTITIKYHKDYAAIYSILEIMNGFMLCRSYARTVFRKKYFMERILFVSLF